MSFKINIGTDSRVIYTLDGGNDSEDGLSLETAKESIQGAVDEVNSLVPPPNAIQRASIIVSGAGAFSENISFPNFTSVDAPASTNAVSSGVNYTLASFAAYQFGLATHSGASGTVFSANNQTALSLTCSQVNITGVGTTCLEISGTTDDSFFRFSQLRLNGDGAIGVNYTASNGEPEVILFASITLEDDNVVAYIHNPSVSTARGVFNVGGITDIGSPTATTAIRVIDGHLSALVNEINATDGIDLQGGELNIISNCIVGDITVAVGSILICEIAEHVGTLINNGTIQGRIGDQYFTSGIVTTSDTLTNNTLLTGNGGVDIDNRANATLTDNGTTLEMFLQSPSVTGSSRYALTDSTGSLKFEMEYVETGDTIEFLATVDMEFAQGPSAGNIRFLGNDTEYVFRSGGTDNALLIDMTASPDTNPPFIIDTGGSNGANIPFFISGRTAAGNISTTGGSFCFSSDDLDSNFFIKKSTGAASTAGWFAGISIDGSGTENSIPTWDASGVSLQDVGNALLTDDGNALLLSLQSPSASGDSAIAFLNNASVTQADITYDQNADLLSIFTTGTIPVSFLAGGNVGIGLIDPTSTFHVLENSTDTGADAGVTIEQEGTGDAITQYLLSGVRRWVVGIDNSDDDRFKFAPGSFDSNIVLSLDTEQVVVLDDLNISNDGTSLNVTATSPVAATGVARFSMRDSLGVTQSSFEYRENVDRTRLFDFSTNGLEIDSASVIDINTTDGVISITTAATLFNTLAIVAPDASSVPRLLLQDSSNVDQLDVRYHSTPDQSRIINSSTNGLELRSIAGRIELRSDFDDILLELNTNTTQIEILGTTHLDDNALLRLATTQGATDIHIGTITPVGNVSVTGGTFYLRDDELDSTILVKKSAGAASTTGWQAFVSTAETSVTNNSVITWNGTDASTIQSVDLITAGTSGFELTLSGATSSTGIQIFDELSVEQLSLTYSGNTDTALLIVDAGNGIDIQTLNGQINILSADDIIISANSGANTVSINADFVFQATTTNAEFDIECPTAGGFAIIQFQNNASAPRLEIGYSQGTDLAAIELFQSSTQLFIAGAAHTDSDVLVSFDTNGIDGGQSNLYISSRTPIGNNVANPASISIREEADISSINFHKGPSANDTDWLTVSLNPADIVEIHSAADLDALASAGVITVSGGDSLTLKFKAAVTTPHRFSITGGGRISIERDGGDHELTYSGTGTFFTAVDSSIVIQNSVGASSTGTLFDVESRLGLFVIIDQASIRNWSLGSIRRSASASSGPSVLLESFVLIPWVDSLTVENATLLSVFDLNVIQFAPVSVPVFVVSNDSAGDHVFSAIEGSVTGSENFIRVDPAINDSSRTLLNNSTISGTLFDTSGSTGTFTVVADASFASESITSVTDSSGVARFNFTAPPTLFVNQEVTTVGYVTNTAYNGTFIITATGAGFFEVSSIAFGTNEAGGSFTSDTVTITDTTTTLVDGNTITLDTADATDYDGGATVYNQLTNTFQVNRTFTVTQTGTWSQAGLDQTDPRVLTNDNPGQETSHYIATAFVNNNATANGAIVNNTFTDMVFGTGGSALVTGTTIERWKLIDELNGTFEYKGNEPFDGSITFDFTVESSGGNVDFRFKWEIDTGGGFADLPDAVEALVNVGSDAQSITKTFPLRASKGDQIKPQITRNSGTSGITTLYATIYATQ